MGVKTKSRLLAVVVALAMVFTSAVGVFAAGSPTKGATNTATKTVVHPTEKTVDVETSSAVQYKINNGAWKTASSSTTIKGLKSGNLVTIKSSTGTTYRWIKSVKIKRCKKNNLRWKKVKGAKYYMVKITKGGKTTWKKVKGTKLKKGVVKGAVISVRPVKVKGGKAYLGALCKERKVK